MSCRSLLASSCVMLTLGCSESRPPVPDGPAPPDSRASDVATADQRRADRPILDRPAPTPDRPPLDLARPDTPAPVKGWVKGFGSGSLDSDVGHAVAADGANNVYVTGSFVGSVDFGGGTLKAGARDVFFASYSSAGAHRFSKRFGGGSYASGNALVTDGSGNCALAGAFNGTVDFGGGGLTTATAGFTNIFVASFDAAGAHRWSSQLGTAEDTGSGVAVDAAGNTLVTGRAGGLVPSGGWGGRLLLASFTVKGALSWSKTFGALPNAWDEGNAIAVDGSGNATLIGDFDQPLDFGGGTVSPSGLPDVAVASFTSTGQHRWSRPIGLSGFGGRGTAVAVDAAGNIFVAGTFKGSANLGGSTLTSNAGSMDVLLASFTSSGAHRWSQRFGGSKSDGATAIALDASGNVYITGSYADVASLGGASLTSAGSSDIFVASYTGGGAHRWSKGIGGSDADAGYGIAVDSAGAVFVTGSFGQTVSFGPQTLTAVGKSDAFLLKIVP